MKGMILAAGLGTRLRPLTDDRPKALVRLGNRTLLEIAIERLRRFGMRELIVNVHHYADMVVEYLRAHDDFGMRIEISREEELLDTGGGLKKAAGFFLEDAEDARTPLIVHNVDVISTIDLDRIVRFHLEQNALATLAVQLRATSRPLVFDATGQLRGRGKAGGEPGQSETGECEAGEHLRSFAFAGIHVLSPRIFSLLEESGAFSIIDAYLRLAAAGERVVAFDGSEYAWRDLGRPAHLEAAAREMELGRFERVE